MTLKPKWFRRCSRLLACGLAIGLVVSPLQPASGQSIEAEADIVGGGISLQAFKDAYCAHYASQHGDLPDTELCESPLVFAMGQSIVTDGDIVGDGISLQVFKDSYCDHLDDEHPGFSQPAFCSMAAGIAPGAIPSALQPASDDSILSDGDIVGAGTSLRALKGSYCLHLRNAHAAFTTPAFCLLGANERFVFATSAKSSAGGDLLQWADDLGLGTFTDGLLAGDAICQKHADDVDLPGIYKAWLSTDTVSGTVNAKDRIGNNRWVLPDTTTVVADSLADLLDCDNPECLQSAISQAEDGSGAPDFIYTGTDASGEWLSATCDDWTSDDSGDLYRYGRTEANTTSWTSSATTQCSFNDALYCFGQ